MGNKAEKSKKEAKENGIKQGKKPGSEQKSGHALPAEQMESLQQQVGNQAVQAMVAQQKGGAGKAAKNEQKPVNNTGMPDNLKAGIEHLSGMNMDDVRVHYNSAKPAQVKAHAYAQGSEIHLASGQEKHLPHEAWHVVQQKQGRVQPTTQVGGMPVNDDAGLESEADQMGAKAAAFEVQRVAEEEETQMKGAEEEEVQQVQMVEEEPIQTEEEEEMVQGAGMEEEEAMQGAGMEEEELVQGAGMEEEEAMQGKRK